jgi:AraC-like DNA-binding protein
MSIPNENTGKKFKSNGAQLNIRYDLTDKLKYSLETEMRYLNANLTLSILAKELHANREYLSRTIHYFFENSYTDLINEYRVKEATRILENFSNGAKTKLNMLEVAHASGFKSTSSFNPAFKKVMGVSPSEYAIRIKKD